MASQIFVGYRSIGSILTGSCPAALSQRGHAYFVTVANEKTFFVYDCAKLRLVAIGPEHPHSIKALCVGKRAVFTASRNVVYAWIDKTLKFSLELPFSRIRLVHILGEFLIVCGSQPGDKPHVIDTVSGKVHQVLDVGTMFETTCVVHPQTYVNKLVFGSSTGELKLFNINTGTLLFTFTGFGSVSSLGQTPALDVIAVGNAMGEIFVHHIKADHTLMKFTQEGLVTSLAFRSDDESRALLMSGRIDGRIVIWDLSAKVLLSVTQILHNSPLVTMSPLKGEPIVLTAAADNALKLWHFDDASFPRLLRSRSGHSQPPRKVRFFDSGRWLLSIAADRTFRVTNIFSDHQSMEISQNKANAAKKSKKYNVSEINFKESLCIDFDACSARSGVWSDAVTCHEDGKARRWDVASRRMTKGALKVSGNALRCCLSPCGNYTYIGSSDGSVTRFNMQSGLKRGTFQAHSKAITAIICDAFHQALLTASMDGLVKFWELPFTESPILRFVYDLNQNQRLDSSLFEPTCSSSATVSVFARHPGSNLIAAAADDGIVRVFDPSLFTVARMFSAHSSPINDICVSGDGRWVISTAQDSTLRVWDIVTGRLVDWLSVPRAITTCAFSPESEFLVTAHAGKIPMFLWSNQDHFSALLLRAPPPLPMSAPLPHAKLIYVPENSEKENDNENKMDLAAGIGEKPSKSVEIQKLEGNTIEDLVEEYEDPGDRATFPPLRIPERQSATVLLTTLPRPNWANIADIDKIRERNKPKEPVKVAKNAPFFLPSLSSAIVSDSVNKRQTFVLNEIGIGEEKNEENNEKTEEFREKWSKEEKEKEKDEIDFGSEMSDESDDEITMDGVEKAQKTRIISPESARVISQFELVLQECETTNNYFAGFQYLLTLSPTAADLAWRSLPTYDTKAGMPSDLDKEREDLLRKCTMVALKRASKCLEAALRSKVHFQPAQAHLQHFLKIHGSTLAFLPDGEDLLTRLSTAQTEAWERIERLTQTGMCMLSYCSGIQA